MVNNPKAVLQDVLDVDVLTKCVEDVAREFRKAESRLGMVDLWRRNIVIDSDKNICLLWIRLVCQFRFGDRQLIMLFERVKGNTVLAVR